MKRGEAEQLLGGYATGTLTESERRILLEAALADQALFDALADEEALRELLADPAARAQLLGALAPRVAPLWRRPGVLGVAAGLLVAGLAGLAVLHGPNEVLVPRAEAPRPSLKAEEVAPAAKVPGPAVPASPAPAARKDAPPPPAPRPLPTPSRTVEAPAALAPGVAMGGLEKQRAEERLNAEDAARSRARADRAPAGGAAVVEGVPAPAPVAGVFRAAATEAAPEPAPEPAWSVATRPDGSLRVTVLAFPGRPVLLLRRGPVGVAVVRPVAAGREGPRLRWWIDVRPVPGEALDLYLLNGPVADPAGLPAEGPVDGVRARIPVPEKKAPVP